MRLTNHLVAAAAALVVVSAAAPRPVTAAPAQPTAVLSTVVAPSFAPVFHAVVTQDIKVDVDTDRGHGAWYTQPVWIAIGIIALVLIILLITAAGRRGGSNTTVVK
jgi:hypothetical protein